MLIDRLGIASDMQNKSKANDGSQLELVACDGIELVVTSMSTLALNKGTELAGPFPPDLQQFVTFNVGPFIASGAEELRPTVS